MYPRFILTGGQVRELDRLAMECYGLKGLVLMENAGRACAVEAESMLGRAAGMRVSVFCGKGNNGGDGFVIARHMANRGSDVRVFCTARVEDILSAGGDAAANLHIVLKIGLPLTEVLSASAVDRAAGDVAGSHLIVDALLGTGITGEVRGVCRDTIEALNASARPVLAVDLPSGLEGDTGAVSGCAVMCRRTVTFAGIKRGFLTPGAADYTGRVILADIGIPRVLIEKKAAEWHSEPVTEYLRP